MTDDLEKLSEGGGDQSDLVESLEKQLEAERDRRREERFLWVVLLIAGVDIVTFGSMQTWAAPVTIFTLQIIGLLVYARQAGIEEVQQFVDKILSSNPFKPDDS